MSDFSGIDLTGKTALVTGSSRGIGAGIAVLLGKRGANVVINYVSEGSKSKAEQVAADIQAVGSKASVCQASVSTMEDIPKLIEAAVALSPNNKIDILVHNAAQGLEADIEDITLEFYNQHFDCNVRGPLFLTQASLPHMGSGGRIVLISSAAARMAVPQQTVYAATKAANESFCRVWAKELGQKYGVTVNCINPGPIATGKRSCEAFYIALLTRKFCEDQWFQSDEKFLREMEPLINSTPAAARVGEVDDVAPLVAFLCSDDARWTTGSVLSANGGLCLF
ncbi:Short-chain dehydrogenase/reductase SDR [Penicillium expansum]|nr:Short-chain dehydrogenase/reductase SDR [Penicillium expansum]